MFLTDWALALWLLTGPAPVNALPQELHKSLRVPMTILALQLELMDMRETRHCLVRDVDFGEDVLLIRRRYLELRNAPKLQEAALFPKGSLVNGMLVLNRDFRKSVEELHRLGFMNGDELASVLVETDQAYRIWDCVRDGNCDYYYVSVRRQALAHLRSLLREEDYRQGRLPPPIPLWRMGVFARPVVWMP